MVQTDSASYHFGINVYIGDCISFYSFFQMIDLK